MREIKFRAWDTVDKDFWQGILLLPDMPIMYFPPKFKQNEHPLVWQQYTGLKDKNGKEIYEGDILQNRNGVFSEVKWDLEQSRWLSLSFGMTQKAIQRDKLFIIGNIYENPELLTPNQG